MKKIRYLIISLGMFLINLQIARPGISSFVLAEANTTPEEFSPGISPGFLDRIVNFLYAVYEYIREGIVSLLNQTIFKDNPSLASFYGGVAIFLASLTSIYIILELFSAAKKIMRIILIIGWILFTISIVVRYRTI